MTQFSTASDSGRGSRSGPPLPPRALIGFLVAFLAVIVISFLAYQSLETRSAAAKHIAKALDTMERIQTYLSTIKDAETGERGFLLTETESYLKPYVDAQASLPGQLQRLRMLTVDYPGQEQRLDTLEQLSNNKMQEIGQTIALRRAGNTAAALAIVRSDRGQATMDSIRLVGTQMQDEQQRLLNAYEKDWQDAARASFIIMLGGAGLLLCLIAAGAIMASRDYRAREIEVWLRAAQAALSAKIQGDLPLDKLGSNALEFLAGYLDARVGAVYIAAEEGHFRRFAGYALAPDAAGEVLRPGDGLLGQVAKDNRPLHVRNVPAGYLSVASSLGRGEPLELLIAPATIDGVVQGVVELGFFRPVLAADQELLARISGLLGVAVRSSKDRSRLEALLEETQQQAEELQAQQEELRVNNEELEERGRALKQSHAQMETQQAELEQTNTQLEAHAQLLEKQRQDLANAQTILREKAADLERSNQYKSEFLANISHELRTPLNSSLILAKLLADNKEGNLSAEQVKFAQTIGSAGNDLLVLINDILDLSKIEAGKVEVRAQPVIIQNPVDELIKSFQPVAQQKGLAFNASLEPGAPQRMETDPQRLAQILKNLISNALKFTEQGQVSLRVFAPTEGMVSFAVRDSGIGIPAHQQGIIFDAFMQADGSTSRKHGGTGLGLSISRDLARLLGGHIAVTSAPNQGSTFTLTLPLVYSEGAKADAAVASNALTPSTLSAGHPAGHPLPAADRSGERVLKPITMDDDRERLSASSRLILVIEDDPRFAAILRDLAHEMGFQCVVTHSASDGLAAAAYYSPSAIVLDINLPDHSGLGVLDRLKRDPRTRHIPVHVASVADYVQEALELGAIGYALKPVKREQLVEAFQRLEAKFSQSMRRVLVVEDDERQRESIQQLLRGGKVQITAVENAGQALAQLQTRTFDCVVMDLNLPDLSGYELLEKMAAQDDVSFPPVIVYTGRSMTSDEEQRLRRYSKAIIIKDARSPERLLDEVTLFLHQVEAELTPEHQRMLKAARDRDATLEGRRILVVEDDVRNVFALSSILEPKGAKVEIARNGVEAIEILSRNTVSGAGAIDLVLMDIMMPEMDGLTAMREIRKRPEWKKLAIIALTAKAMKDDQEKCLAAGANDYIAKPLDVEKLLSLVRVWMPK